MKRSFVVDGQRGGPDSRVIEAMNRLEGEIVLDTERADTNGLYGHTVIIQTGNVTINLNELDCEFDIPFDDNT